MQLVSRLKTLFFMTCLVFVGQVFAVTPEPFDCSAGATWGGYTLQEASLVNGSYEIDTPEKLAWFSCYLNNQHVDNAYINAKLTANLTMNSDDANEGDKKFWIPICAGPGGKAKDNIIYCKYAGVFDGNNHKISNLYLNSDFLEQMNVYYTQNVGFVGAFSGTVKNLILENIQVLGSGDGGKYVTGGDCVAKPVSIGTLVGWSNGSVKDCIVSGNIVTSGVGQAVGGLVGNAGGGSITGSVSEVAIDANGLAYAGGIVGYTKNTVSISSCVYAGSGVSSTGSAVVGDKTYQSKAGGVVGSRYSGTVTANNVYYDDSSVDGAIGNGNINGSPTGSSDVNNEEVACVLNGGTWSEETCVGATSSAWSVGFLGLSYEGSDGYMVTFDANGGGFPSGAKKYNVVISGTTVTTNGISIPSRDGYAFLGWSRNKNATTPDENLGEVNGQTTVYAVWNPVIEITFDANGGYFPPDPLTVTKAKLVPTGDPITVEGIEPLPEKYCTGTVNGENCDGGKWMYFRGWSFNDGASVNDAIDLNQLSIFASSENTTLYAIWTEVETYTVTFHAEGHGKTKVAFTETTVQGGGLVNEPEEGFAVPDEGYEFDGWWTEKNGGILFEFENTPIMHSIILYAHWKTTDYKITCVNASCDPDHQTYNIESDFAFYTPTKPGYTFDGWFYEDQFSTKAEGVKPGATGPLTIYAKWSEATYTIAYRAGSYGNGEVLPETVNYGTSYTLRGISYTREGYVQDGWSNEGGEKIFEFGEKITVSKNYVLYPYWVRGSKFGAVTIIENEDGTKNAVINGNYGGGDEPNLDEADETVISSDITVNSVTLNRTFNAGKIATLYVPFEIDAENVVGTEVYKFKTVVKGEDGRWKFKVSTATKVMPNTPYVIIPEGTQVTFNITTPVTLNTTTAGEATAANNWEFVGAYQYEKFTIDNDNPIYLFANEERDGAKLGEFVKIAEGAFINPLRAYLVYHKSAALPKSAGGNLGSNILLPDELDIEVENENGVVVQTGKLNTVTGEVRMDRWYDLKGRKMNSKPTVKGTYYKNGKRVVIK